jgi:ABC-2 type transport system permease protein
LVFAIGAGARIVAGEEEAGILDLVLSHPVSRESMVLQRFAALVTAVAVMVAAFWLAMLVIAGPADFGSVAAGSLAAMHLHLALFTLLFSSVSFAVGAATGRRGLALAVAATAGVLAYAASGILPQVEALRWTRDYSAFTWLNGSQPLRDGIDAGHLGIMLVLTVLFVGVGTLAFRRRDVAV